MTDPHFSPNGPSTRWVVHTDGACAPTNPGPCAWGALVQAPETGAHTPYSGFIGHGTNQVAELVAAIEGLRRTPRGARVDLYSDSQYVVRGANEWRAGWQRRGWRNSKGEPVANQTLWYQLFGLLDERQVRLHWVRGHNGHRGNELADALAVAALAAGAKRPWRAGEKTP